MEITCLTHYKGKTFEVEIDNERKLYLHIDIITDFGISKGMEIERTELRKIVYASNFRRAYEYALYRLDYRDYSAEEIYEKLLETYKNEALCLEVVKKLARAGIINDERYAEKLARKLVESKKYGYRRAKREMMQKGLTEDTVYNALKQYDDIFEENLALLLRGKYSRYLTDKTDKKSVEKAKNALARYGYSYDEINRAAAEYFE
ncbi:MAG: RecX family transcriptional regulator [Ruminococcus sp.]|nr:RecX family transcriptional regulator [Ruminococcus sp.]